MSALLTDPDVVLVVNDRDGASDSAPESVTVHR